MSQRKLRRPAAREWVVTAKRAIDALLKAKPEPFNVPAFLDIETMPGIARAEDEREARSAGSHSLWRTRLPSPRSTMSKMLTKNYSLL